MNLKLKNTKVYLRGYTDRLIKLLKREITRSRVRTYKKSRSSNYPINDTGSLANSIKRLRVKNTNEGFSYGTEGNSYAIPLNEEKKRNKAPRIENIISWIQSKRITLTDGGKPVSVNDLPKVKSIAFAISRSIGEDGVKETGFINSAIEKSKSDLNKLGSAIGKDILLNVDDILLKAGYIKKGENYIIENASK